MVFLDFSHGQLASLMFFLNYAIVLYVKPLLNLPIKIILKLNENLSLKITFGEIVRLTKIITHYLFPA